MEAIRSGSRRLTARALLAVALIGVSLLPALPAAAQTQARLCPGDCRGRGRVAVSDLALGVRIALGLEAAAACPAMDPFRTGQIMVPQLIRAVSSVLFGCGELIQDTLTDFDVVDLGAAGALRLGAPPGPSGGPTLTVPDAATVPGGITAGVPIQASAPVEKIFLAIDNAFGFYEVTLPEPVTVFPADVVFANAPPRTRFDCLFSVADTEGRIGTIGVTSITIARPLVQETISDISPSTVPGTTQLVDGLPPPPTGGPNPMVPGNSIIQVPLTTTFAIRADAPFSSVVVSVRGASGYFQVDLATPTTSRNFDLSISATPLLDGDLFFVLTQVIAPDGTVGPTGSTRFRVLDEE